MVHVIEVSASVWDLDKGVTKVSFQVVSASPQMAQCLCQSMFDTFTSVFSTSYLMCTKTFLNSHSKTVREQRDGPKKTLDNLKTLLHWMSG